MSCCNFRTDSFLEATKKPVRCKWQDSRFSFFFCNHLYIWHFVLFVCLFFGTHSAGLLYMGGILSIVESCCSRVIIWPLLQCRLFNVVGVVWIVLRCGCYSVNYLTLMIQWKVMKGGCDSVSCWMLLLQCQLLNVVVTVLVCTCVFHNVSCWMLLLQCQFVVCVSQCQLLNVAVTVSVCTCVFHSVSYWMLLLQCQFVRVCFKMLVVECCCYSVSLYVCVSQCQLVHVSVTLSIIARHCYSVAFWTYLKQREY